MRATILMVLAVVVGSLLPQGGHPPTPDASPPQACAHRLLSTGCATAKARVPVKSGSGTLALDPLSTPLDRLHRRGRLERARPIRRLTRFSPDGRVFVAEKCGIIKVFAPRRPRRRRCSRTPRRRPQLLGSRPAGARARPELPHPALRLRRLHLRPRPRLGGGGAALGHAGGIADNCPTPPGPPPTGASSGRVVRLKASAATPTSGTDPACSSRTGASSTRLTRSGPSRSAPTAKLWVSGGEGASFNFADYGQGAAGGTSAG